MTKKIIPLTIADLQKGYEEKKISVEEVIAESKNISEKWSHLNFMITKLYDSSILNLKATTKKGPLWGIPYATKDNFCTKDIRTTASSKILDNFIPNYDSEVVSLLNQAQGLNVCKVSLDELGMGGHGLYSYTGPVLNPWSKNKIIGGSSSGSAAVVGIGAVPFSLGTDTGDSIRKPAAYAGIVGFKPSYGLISRYGVIPYAPSLDTVGVFTRSVQDVAILTDILAKKDHKDFTNIASVEREYEKNLNPDLKGKKIAFIKSAWHAISSEMRQNYEELFEQIREQGANIVFIDFPEVLLKALAPIYEVISFSEAVSTHSNLDGIKFGIREKVSAAEENYKNLMKTSRFEGLGRVVRRRFIIGSYCLQKNNQKDLFLKSKKIRTMIIEAIDKVFKDYDCLFLPPNNGITPDVSEIMNKKINLLDENDFINSILVLANLAGTPSITVPTGFIENMPIGININTKQFADQECLNIALAIEKITGLKNLYCKGEK